MRLKPAASRLGKSTFHGVGRLLAICRQHCESKLEDELKPSNQRTWVRLASGRAQFTSFLSDGVAKLEPRSCGDRPISRRGIIQ